MSAHTRIRDPDAVFTHLRFSMAAMTISWTDAEHFNQAPIRRCTA